MANIMIRMGDELLICGKRYEALWNAVEDTRRVLNDGDQR